MSYSVPKLCGCKGCRNPINAQRARKDGKVDDLIGPAMAEAVARRVCPACARAIARDVHAGLALYVSANATIADSLREAGRPQWVAALVGLDFAGHALVASLDGRQTLAPDRKTVLNLFEQHVKQLIDFLNEEGGAL